MALHAPEEKTSILPKLRIIQLIAAVVCCLGLPTSIINLIQEMGQCGCQNSESNAVIFELTMFRTR